MRFLVADMPYGSYHVSADEAVRNASRYVKEAGAEAVKIEGGEKRADLIRRIIDAEIPGCRTYRTHAAIRQRNGRIQSSGQDASGD